jgi:hypothetical protein
MENNIYLTLAKSFFQKILSLIVVFFVFSMVSVFAQAGNQTIPAGSYIVNMGIQPQTQGNALKPYGMVFDLVRKHKIPIIWSIKPNKTQNGIDFTLPNGGNSYKGGPFIIKPEFLSPAVLATIATWTAQGVVIDVAPTSFIAPVYIEIEWILTWTLDQQNGGIAQDYLDAAGIPSAYNNYKEPQNLDCCND